MTRPERRGHPGWDLEVLVSNGCAGCGHALTVVAQLCATHPRLRVGVTDVDEPGWGAPPGFGGPPRVLGGDRILSLGNPTPEALRDALTTPGAP